MARREMGESAPPELPRRRTTDEMVGVQLFPEEGLWSQYPVELQLQVQEVIDQQQKGSNRRRRRRATGLKHQRSRGQERGSSRGNVCIGIGKGATKPLVRGRRGVQLGGPDNAADGPSSFQTEDLVPTILEVEETETEVVMEEQLLP